MELDLIFEGGDWDEAALAPVMRRAFEAALVRLGHGEAAFEAAVLACDDAKIAELNGSFRGKAAPTNVLSWPSEDRAAATPGGVPDPPRTPELGDIAIAYETCMREAAALERDISDHVSHLIVHGTLHLLGYDHETEQDAVLMEGLETEILASLGVPDPYS